MNFKKIESHKNWSFVKEIFQKLKYHKFQVFLVGGSVRDLLMGKTPRDFDLTTNAKFDHLKKLFPQSIKVGQSFKVLKIVHKNSIIEVSSFRKDGPYQDGRHPSFVRYGSQREDALRRDFTINSMFYDLENGSIIDFFSGKKDLKNKLIQSTGSPQKKFEEDHLRILRAFRFVSKLNFDIEKKTFLSILNLSSKISLISKERINTEFKEILSNSFRLKAMNYLSLTPIIEILFPFYKIHTLKQDKEALTLWTQVKYFLNQPVSFSFPSILALFFLNQIKYWEDRKECTWLEGTKKIIDSLKNLRFSKEILLNTESILKHHWFNKVNLASRLIFLNSKNGKNFFKLFDEELIFITKKGILNKIKKEKALTLRRYKVLLKNNKRLPSPWFRGHDLMNLGISLKGKSFGNLLKSLYEYQLSGKFKNKNEALKWIQYQNSNAFGVKK